MARKTQIITVTSDGRDKGKSFLITEFPPRRAEAWAYRALSSVARSGQSGLDAETMDAIRDTGMAAVAALGLRAITSLPYDDAQPLLDEMIEAVSFVPDKSKIDKSTMAPYSRFLTDDDIEEVATVLQLRDEVFKLHTGFSVAAFLSQLGSAAKQAIAPKGIPTSPSSSETS